VVEGDFAEGFAILCAQNVVNCVVDCGGFVVKAWLETAVNRALKNTPTFEIFLWKSMRRR
jgi:hypothetical protein